MTTPKGVLSATLMGWYDASQDNATPGTVKARITDKSTRAKPLTATGAPILDTAPDGVRFYRFDGVNDYATAASAADWAFLNAGPHTVFAVVTLDHHSGDGRSTICDTGGLSSNDTGFWLSFDDRSAGVGGFGPDGGSARSTRGSAGNDNYQLNTGPQTLLPGHRQLIIVRAGSPADLRIDGELGLTVTDTSVTFGGTTPAGPLRVAARNNATLLPGAIQVHELAFFDGAISDADLEALTTYANSKWHLNTWLAVSNAPIANTTSYDAFPAVARANNGDLIAVARRGSGHLSTDGDIVQWRSTDLGVTWGPSEVIASHLTYRDLRDPGIMRMGNGQLLLVAGLRPGGNSIPDGCRWATSPDSGVTWTPMQTLNDAFAGFSRCAGRPTKLADGSLLWAIYGNDNAGSGDNDLVRWVKVYRSTNNAKSWSYLSDIGAHADNTGWGEPSVIQAPNGNVIALVRNTTTNELCRAVSTDGGATWDTLTAVLPDADSSPKPMWSARGLLLTTQRKSSNGVGYLCFSDDLGATWQRGQMLSPNTYMYGDFVVVGGKVIIVYSAEPSTGAVTHSSDADVYCARFTERAGAAVVYA